MTPAESARVNRYASELVAYDGPTAAKEQMKGIVAGLEAVEQAARDEADLVRFNCTPEMPPRPDQPAWMACMPQSGGPSGRGPVRPSALPR